LQKEKEHPKLIKTIGSPNYGNVQCSLQDTGAGDFASSNNNVEQILEDTSGNLWVGTRETGLYLYDGKKFINYSEYKLTPNHTSPSSSSGHNRASTSPPAPAPAGWHTGYPAPSSCSPHPVVQPAVDENS